MSDDLLVQAIIGYWGERCADTDPDCACCQAWLAYDRQAAERDRLRDALKEVCDAWDWWNVDTYDRCSSVPSDAVREARAALEDTQ